MSRWPRSTENGQSSAVYTHVVTKLGCSSTVSSSRLQRSRVAGYPDTRGPWLQGPPHSPGNYEIGSTQAPLSTRMAAWWRMAPRAQSGPASIARLTALSSGMILPDLEQPMRSMGLSMLPSWWRWVAERLQEDGS